MNPQDCYGRIPLIWEFPGQGSDSLIIYLGDVMGRQELCGEVDKIADMMPRPYAFVKELSREMKIRMLEIDLDNLVQDADTLEKESGKLLAKFGI